MSWRRADGILIVVGTVSCTHISIYLWLVYDDDDDEEELDRGHIWDEMT